MDLWLQIVNQIRLFEPSHLTQVSPLDMGKDVVLGPTLQIKLRARR